VNRERNKNEERKKKGGFLVVGSCGGTPELPGEKDSGKMRKKEEGYSRVEGEGWFKQKKRVCRSC